MTALDVFGHFGQIQLVGGVEADQVVLLPVDALVTVLALGAALFSSVVGQVEFFFREILVEIEVAIAERSAQFFAHSVVVLGVAVLAGVAPFVDIVKSEAVFVVVFVRLEAEAPIQTSELLLGLVLEVVALLAFIALGKRGVSGQFAVLDLLAGPDHLEEVVSNCPEAWLALEANGCGLGIVKVSIGAVFL